MAVWFVAECKNIGAVAVKAYWKTICHLVSPWLMPSRNNIGSLNISGKLPTYMYPSPKPTLTLTSHLGQNVGLREGQVGSFPETYNTWSLFSSLSSVTVPDVFAKAHSTQMSFRKFTRSSSFLFSKVAKFNKGDYSKIIFCMIRFLFFSLRAILELLENTAQ